MISYKFWKYFDVLMYKMEDIPEENDDTFKVIVTNLDLFNRLNEHNVLAVVESEQEIKLSSCENVGRNTQGKLGKGIFDIYDYYECVDD